MKYKPKDPFSNKDMFISDAAQDHEFKGLLYALIIIIAIAVLNGVLA